MELKDVSKKISAFIAAGADISSIAGQVEKTLNESLRKADEAKQEEAQIRTSIENAWREHGQMKNDVFSEAQKVKDEAIKVKAEAQAMMSQVQEKMSNADKYLASAKLRDEDSTAKNVEISALKAELEERVSKAREFAAAFK